MNHRLIKHVLVDRDLTLAELARLAGLSYDRTIRIIHGYRKPTAEEIERLARILGTTPGELTDPSTANETSSTGR